MGSSRARSRLIFGAALAAAPILLTAVAVATAAVPQQRIVHCEEAVDQTPPPEPSPLERVLLDRIAVARRDGLGEPHATAPPPFRYFSKTGLMVRRGRTTVDLIVPRSWRSRFAIGWGAGGYVSSLRILGCSSAEEWLMYTGGFYVSRLACVPLVVRVGARTAHVRFGIGKRCESR
ncbi:MAG TPA: hypothetical protein VGJ77_22800 [Gaiellaceae bacterium]